MYTTANNTNLLKFLTESQVKRIAESTQLCLSIVHKVLRNVGTYTGNERHYTMVVTKANNILKG